MQAHVRTMLAIAAAVGLLLLAVVAQALQETVESSQRSAADVAHTHEVLEVAAGLAASAQLLDASQRALLVTGASYFREGRVDALESMRRGVHALRGLTADNPQQQRRLRELEKLVDERANLAVRDEIVSRDPAAERFGLESPAALASANALRTALADLRAHEQQLLVARQQRLEEQHRRTLQVVGATIAVGVLLLGWWVWGYRRQAMLHGRAESRFRDLVQGLPVSLWQLRAEPGGRETFEFVSDNTPALRRLGIEDVRSAAENALLSIHEEDRARVRRSMRRAIDNLQPYDEEYRVPLPDGVRWIHASARVRRTADGAVVLNGYWVDVTRERALLDALEAARDDATRAMEAKSAFLAAMSHEIRTPMNGVLGLLELLGLTPLDAGQKATLAVVRSSGQSLLRIVDDILDFSKMEAARLTLRPAPASLRQLVDATCQIYAGQASAKGLLLQGMVAEPVGRAHVFDRQRLGQILNNLVSNALKFTERGSVTLRVASTGVDAGTERLEITVEDTGIGVPPAEAERLFQPFVQAAQGSAGHQPGTGLGLVISRGLAELMGGSLTMHSVPGVGTRLLLDLAFPLADAEGQAFAEEPERSDDLPRTVARARPAPTAAVAQAEGTLVLVVDDHPTNRMVLMRQLQSLGYACDTAADGLQGFEAWKTGRYALVMADCNMPGMNGYELARAIRAHEESQGLPRTPILACTANSMPSEAAVCAEAGMDELLLKPIALGPLARHLAHWLPLPEPEPPLAHGVDPRTLQALGGDDAQVRAGVLDEYRRAHECDAIALRDALRTADAATALQLAHRIRGACVALGSLALAEATGELEQVLREGRWDQVPGVLEAFDAELARLFDALDRDAPRGA